MWLLGLLPEAMAYDLLRNSILPFLSWGQMFCPVGSYLVGEVCASLIRNQTVWGQMPACDVRAMCVPLPGAVAWWVTAY